MRVSATPTPSAFLNDSPPHDLIETLDAAMQMVRTIVRCKRVGLAFESEAALRDAIAISSDNRAEERRILQVRLERGSEHDVVQFARAIRNAQ
jgi:hypothetical protein